MEYICGLQPCTYVAGSALGLLLFSGSGRAAQRASGAAQAQPTPLGWAGTGTLATWTGQAKKNLSFGPSYQVVSCMAIYSSSPQAQPRRTRCRCKPKGRGQEEMHLLAASILLLKPSKAICKALFFTCTRPPMLPLPFQPQPF